MLGGIAGSFRGLMEEGPYGFFETAVDRRLGDAICEDKEVGKLLWSALANVSWKHAIYGEVSYSFRAAGDLIAAIREEGDYMDWYCCGPEATIDPVIANALKLEGWVGDTKE